MRRIPTLLFVLALLALPIGCSDDTAAVDGRGDEATSTSSSHPATSTSTTATTSTTTTATIPTTTTTQPIDDDPTGPPERMPDLLVAQGVEVWRHELRPDDTMFVRFIVETDRPAAALHQAADGTIFTREFRTEADETVTFEHVRYRDGGRTVLDGVANVYDVAVFDGVDVVIVERRGAGEFPTGSVVALAVDDLREVADLGPSADVEFGVTDFAWSEPAELGVYSAWADLTEWIGFRDRAGGEVELPSPTDELAYNSPPYVTAATISQDGRTLYWAEGPDWGFDAATGESGPIAAPWVLRGADLETGEERLYWPLSEPVVDSAELSVHSLDDIGGRILVNRTRLDGTTPVALAPLVLDLTTEEPDLFEYPATGIAALAPADVIG